MLTGILFVFTVLLSCFFDAMGTIMGIGDEAKLTDAEGQMPGINKVLFVDGIAVAAGGASSSSATTCFVESTAGVGEGARTGFANVVTGLLFAAALFLTPVATMVPSQAATPALIAVGFLILSHSIKDIDWADYTIAIPAFVTMLMMPFTYSITNGIGMGFLTFVVLRLAAGRAREVPVALYVVAAVFGFYYLMLYAGPDLIAGRLARRVRGGVGVPVELLRPLDGGLEPLVEVITNERPDDIVLDAHSSFAARCRSRSSSSPSMRRLSTLVPMATRVAGFAGVVEGFLLPCHSYG